MNRAFLRNLAEEFKPSRLLATLMAGLIIGLLMVMIDISLAALIFSGELARFVSNGIGVMLFGSCVIGVTVALTSSLQGAVGLTQDIPAAILAPAAAGIVARISVTSSPESTYATVVAATAITSLVTGIGFLLMGIFRLGSLIRFIPSPVIGGFLAGSGWLLVKGSFFVMTDVPLTFGGLASLVQVGVLVKWLPGLLFAVLLYVMARRFKFFLIIPSLLLGAILVFYVVLLAKGVSLGEASAQGWFLGPFPQKGLWQPITLTELRLVNWNVLLGSAGSIGTVLLVSAVSLLLNASGLELTLRQDIDLDHELRSTGIANLLSGLGGGASGFVTLSLSTLGFRIRKGSRLIGVIGALVGLLVLIFGAPLLSLLPKQVIGGLLLFLGLSFVMDWVYDGWFKMTKRDWVFVILIMVAMNSLGVLEGVGLGILMAIGLFIFDYSRTSVVRHVLSGKTFRSNVDRPENYVKYLDENGDLIYILELQGFLFFGTTNKLQLLLRRRVDDQELPCPSFVVLDFRHVSGIDTSAALSFVKMNYLAQTNDFRLVLTHLSPEMQVKLEREMTSESGAAHWCTFDDLQHGVAWCEEELLRSDRCVDIASTTIFQEMEAVLPRPGGVVKLQAYCERIEMEDGQVLIRQGQAPSGLFFIASGGAEAVLVLGEGKSLRLRKLRGTIVGEIGLYSGRPATASVIADQTGTTYFLSNEKLKEMEKKDPDLASALHKYIAKLLSERLAYSNKMVETLLE